MGPGLVISVREHHSLQTQTHINIVNMHLHSRLLYQHKAATALHHTLADMPLLRQHVFPFLYRAHPTGHQATPKKALLSFACSGKWHKPDCQQLPVIVTLQQSKEAIPRTWNTASVQATSLHKRTRRMAAALSSTPLAIGGSHQLAVA